MGLFDVTERGLDSSICGIGMPFVFNNEDSVCELYFKMDDFKAIMQLQTHQKDLGVRRYVEVSKQREDNPLSDGIRNAKKFLPGPTKDLFTSHLSMDFSQDFFCFAVRPGLISHSRLVWNFQPSCLR